MVYEINNSFTDIKGDILNIPKLFSKQGELLAQHRNTVKILDVNKYKLNVKSFKIPNIINRFVYKYIRPSKAERSFKYAQKLKELGVNTPQPVAYLEFSNLYGLTNSYYISFQEEYDLLFKDMIGKEISEIKQILIEFTRFTYYMHTKGIYFIDHSPGNTLITKTDNGYRFSLVDLNRINFFDKPLDIDLGIKNFYRLGSTPEMVEVMAEEYAKLRNINPKIVYDKMMNMTMDHNAKVRKKRENKR